MISDVSYLAIHFISTPSWDEKNRFTIIINFTDFLLDVSAFQ
jgi:hypothetical protein